MKPHVTLTPPSARSGWWSLLAHHLDGERGWALLLELPGDTLPGSSRRGRAVRRGLRDLERVLAQHAISALAYAASSGLDVLLLDATRRLGGEVDLPERVLVLPQELQVLSRFLKALDVLSGGEVPAVGTLRHWLALRLREEVRR